MLRSAGPSMNVSASTYRASMPPRTRNGPNGTPWPPPMASDRRLHGLRGGLRRAPGEELTVQLVHRLTSRGPGGDGGRGGDGEEASRQIDGVRRGGRGRLVHLSGFGNRRRRRGLGSGSQYRRGLHRRSGLWLGVGGRHRGRCRLRLHRGWGPGRSGLQRGGRRRSCLDRGRRFGDRRRSGVGLGHHGRLRGGRSLAEDQEEPVAVAADIDGYLGRHAQQHADLPRCGGDLDSVEPSGGRQQRGIEPVGRRPGEAGAPGKGASEGDVADRDAGAFTLTVNGDHPGLARERDPYRKVGIESGEVHRLDPRRRGRQQEHGQQAHLSAPWRLLASF